MDRELTEAESDFANTLVTALETLASVQEKSKRVADEGGDCLYALLSVVPEEAKPDIQMQWPYISLLLAT